MGALLSGLFCYPVKSCGGVPLPRARLVQTGLEWDRHWMIVGPDGTFLTQRTHPRLALLRPRVIQDATVGAGPGGVLEIAAGGIPPLHVPLDVDAFSTSVPVRVWDDRCEAADQGDEAAAWISGFLGQPVRLVRVSPATRRIANPSYVGDVAAPVAFSDGYPILVINRSSLDDLNARLPEPLPIERFRPNVVIDGLEPFAEDRIASLAIGATVLRLVKPCTRCVITATDQQTGERALDPLPVLRTFRFDRGLRGVTFGENAVIAAGHGATLSCGDTVDVTFDASGS